LETGRTPLVLTLQCLETGRTPLMLTLQCLQADRTPLMLTLQCLQAGRTPLRLASLQGHVQAVTLLLEAPGIDANIANQVIAIRF
jgi:Ankyrin repeat